MANIIAGNAYGEKLCKALGIDVNVAHVSRIVIDVRPTEPVRVHVEMLGSTTLLDVELPTTDLEIVTYGQE